MREPGPFSICWGHIVSLIARELSLYICETAGGHYGLVGKIPWRAQHCFRVAGVVVSAVLESAVPSFQTNQNGASLFLICKHNEAGDSLIFRGWCRIKGFASYSPLPKRKKKRRGGGSGVIKLFKWPRLFNLHSQIGNISARLGLKPSHISGKLGGKCHRGRGGKR